MQRGNEADYEIRSGMKGETTVAELEKLRKIAQKLRVDVVTSIYTVKSGHPGGSLSAAELITGLYFYKMRVDPSAPQWSGRDRFVLSKGHAAPVLYAALARRGFFPMEELSRLRQVESHLQGAPNLKTPGIDMSAGPLGQGLSAAVGMALAARCLKQEFRVYCMMGDGELQEGQVWEAAMAAPKFRLGRLIGILDYNKVQMTGTNDEIMPLGDVCAKFQAFGWEVLRIDGNDIEQVILALDASDRYMEGEVPLMIVADTIKGKGVSYMEGQAKWHGGVPDEAQYHKAMAELLGEAERPYEGEERREE